MRYISSLVACMVACAAVAAPASATPPYLYVIESLTADSFTATHADPVTTTIFEVARVATDACPAQELFKTTNMDISAPNMASFEDLISMMKSLKPKQQVVLRYVPCRQGAKYNISTGALCAAGYPKDLGYALCSPVQVIVQEKTKNYL